ncbi:hypothetical protein GCK72_025131 [Caenorhabditis remanei]|uniref:Uncharacterized protein n=1 Tax=Caenorhabditis remanei TaxID=31234 RepID=A0A6A5G218_CAERE|nr:hypothetical protein GCK72_025131 [Caenorhabditis remanei]KAF1748664.1 hypothetical protein GCK72_025131 [Caenorhabditis remanei]
MKLLIFLTICVTVSSHEALPYEAQSVEGDFSEKNGYPQPQPPCLTCLPGHPSMPGQANPRLPSLPRPYPSNPAGPANAGVPPMPPGIPGNPGIQSNPEPQTYSVPEMNQTVYQPQLEHIPSQPVPGSQGNRRPDTYSVPEMPLLPYQPQLEIIPSLPVPVYPAHPYYPMPVLAPAQPQNPQNPQNPLNQAPNLPAPEPYQGGSFQQGQYSGSGPSYPEYNPSYGYPTNTSDFRKLRTLHGNKIIKAKLRYFKNDNINFVVISCPKNPTPGAYTWILADSKHTSPSFGVPQTVALAGGINIEFIAKFGEHGKWEGKDLSEDEKHRFRRVGCIHGATQSFVKL